MLISEVGKMSISFFRLSSSLESSLPSPFIDSRHSFSNRTGPAVGPVKDQTRAYTGPFHLKDRPCNRTAKNRLDRPVFYGTGELAGSM
jgi:hypothetical protein